MHYAADLWRYFGINYLDAWDLEAFDFFSMAAGLDRKRTEPD